MYIKYEVMVQEIGKKLEQLRGQIRRHDRLYYVLNRPEISDQAYDELFAELKKLEQQRPDLVVADSPTQRVSGEPISRFAAITHAQPMPNSCISKSSPAQAKRMPSTCLTRAPPHAKPKLRPNKTFAQPVPQAQPKQISGTATAKPKLGPSPSPAYA